MFAGGELSPVTLATSVGFAEAAASSADAADSRAALAGVSIRGSLALLCAADSRVADHVSGVVCIAPYSDLARVMLLATTGSYAFADGVRPYPVPPYLAVAASMAMPTTQNDRHGLEGRKPSVRASCPEAAVADKTQAKMIQPSQTCSRVGVQTATRTNP